jgi:hypothetical protein
MSVRSFFSKLGKGILNGLRKTGNALVGGVTGFFGGSLGSV